LCCALKHLRISAGSGSSSKAAIWRNCPSLLQ
jgi:hypothetical protein